MTYQSARTQFAPFTELHFTDDETIHLLADRIAQQKALGAVSLVIINNKAEGCAPLSVQRLDNAIAQRLSSLKTTS